MLIQLGLIQLRFRNNRHPVDGVLVGAGSCDKAIPCHLYSLFTFQSTTVFKLSNFLEKIISDLAKN
jgi:dihydroxyacid dehydratase/phosphogluconate dehydratase